MSDDRPKTNRHEGTNHQGPAHASPYPVSRMAPVHDLVDVAAQIQAADALLGTVTGAKLTVIADQIRRLQEEAHAILARAKRDAELHRAKCNFERRAGAVYHLYERASGEVYFSMLGPNEWSIARAQTHLGSYRLEADMSWTNVEDLASRDEERRREQAIRGLLEAPGGLR